jgi:pathogenesis-related protein 1
LVRASQIGVGEAPLITALLLLAMVGCASQPAAVARPAGKEAAKAAVASRMAAKDIKAIIAYHNKVRTDVGVGPLKWSSSLAAYAQEWADQLAGATCKMKHRTEGKYGENLYQGTAGVFTAVDAAKAWETERKDYRGGALTQSNWQRAGHYTQMVWRDSKAVGCGEAVCNKTLIVACNYDPAGNVIGRRPY